MDQKQKGTIKVVGGMALLMIGKKAEGLGLFAKGVFDLEKIYKENHPDLEPGIKARWDNAVQFYEETHQNETNRKLHRLGIPLIVGGAIGLIASKPYKRVWLLSASAFTVGWTMNIVGHSGYEKKKPAFTEDPLSFIAGPVWDLQQILNKTERISE